MLIAYVIPVLIPLLLVSALIGLALNQLADYKNFYRITKRLPSSRGGFVSYGMLLQLASDATMGGREISGELEANDDIGKLIWPPAVKGYPLLRSAIDANNVAMVKLIVGGGCNPNIQVEIAV